MRVFVAAELPEEVRDRVAEAARALLAGVRAAKPVASGNLHVTVRFVGEVPDAAVPRLLGAIGDAAASVAVGETEARGIGAFPDERRPRVVWIGIDDPNEVLSGLEAAISAELAPLGHRREARPYSPHLTVARIREGSRDLGPLPVRLEAARARPPVFGPVPVRSVTVFRSELGRDGPRHTALARLPLAHSPTRGGEAAARSQR